MELLPIEDHALGNHSYLVDLGDGGALVVDPVRDPRRYLDELARRRLEPRFVVETHLHADFVSGGRELAARGARLLAPAGSALAFAHEPLGDGDELDLGGLRLRVIATPGHTPEHLAYLLTDGSSPVALFSGGTLMVAGVARPDLLTPEQTEPLARAAYRSIRDRLLTLPDGLTVYPTHGAGSFCSAAADAGPTTTIGRERTTNPLLVDADEDEFVRRLLGGLGTYPPYFLELREVNRAGPRIHGTAVPSLTRRSAAELARVQADGAEVVDVRDIGAFAAAHVPGSLSIPWRPAFSTWLGWLVARSTPIVFVVDDDVPIEELVWSCRNVGYERLDGVLDGGMDAWTAAGFEVWSIPLLTPDQVAGLRRIDVRQQAEYLAGHAEDATNIELGLIGDRAAELGDEDLLVHCGHGERAMSAASLLRRRGRRDVAVLAGGPDDLGPAA